MDERFEPSNIDVRRTEGIAITYRDGYVASFDLATLRAACPCAACRGRRDRGDVPGPPSQDAAALRIEDAELHGAWGLHVTWGDGHRTGIYPFESLRTWHELGEAYPPDSGLGGAGS